VLAASSPPARRLAVSVAFSRVQRERFFAQLISLAGDGRAPNIVRLMFDPAGLRPFVANSESVAESLVQRIHREAREGSPNFSTVTTLGTPLDVTLQEIRIECFFPANEDTERRTRGMAEY
jgi:hypothetical protein